ncbi:unnamed protein product [Hydatigera taeniaeformis]|uniref:Uncharacterized protein n=1 Tax=Hydatigena taeniaeformis TaxID=6205 RepID=A0A0R3X5H6_HYDTA|nr:unnamed protein product [Hydatigera taeniaeformis]
MEQAVLPPETRQCPAEVVTKRLQQAYSPLTSNSDCQHQRRLLQEVGGVVRFLQLLCDEGWSAGLSKLVAGRRKKYDATSNDMAWHGMARLDMVVCDSHCGHLSSVISRHIITASQESRHRQQNEAKLSQPPLTERMWVAIDIRCECLAPNALCKPLQKEGRGETDSQVGNARVTVMITSTRASVHIAISYAYIPTFLPAGFYVEEAIDLDSTVFPPYANLEFFIGRYRVMKSVSFPGGGDSSETDLSNRLTIFILSEEEKQKRNKKKKKKEEEEEEGEGEEEEEEEVDINTST